MNAGDGRLYAPATERNRAPILAVLEPLLEEGCVLEVASGTGEHVTWFAAQMPALRVLPSDPDPAHRASIAHWTRALGVANNLSLVLRRAGAPRSSPR